MSHIDIVNTFSHVNVFQLPVITLHWTEILNLCQNITTIFPFGFILLKFCSRFSCPQLERYSSIFFSIDFVILTLPLRSQFMWDPPSWMLLRNYSVLFFSIQGASFPSGIYETVQFFICLIHGILSSYSHSFRFPDLFSIQVHFVPVPVVQCSDYVNI